MSSRTPAEMLNEIHDLRQRLAEAEETLRAITGGEVDALVVKTKLGEQVFTLQGADTIYRTAIENVSEGILTLSSEGVILYSNRYFAEMLRTGLNRLMGSSIFELVDAENAPVLRSLIEQESGRGEVSLRTADGSQVPTYIATRQLHIDNLLSVSAVVTDLTLQKRSEEIIRSGRLMAAINRIFREYLTRATEEELGEYCLDVAAELTQSEFGFIGRIGDDGLLHDVAMTGMAGAACAMPDKTGHRRLPGDFEIHGLYGQVIIDGKSLLSNEPANHPDSTGTPPGHPPIKSFLGVPLFYEGTITGLLGLANRKGGYRPEDQAAAEALAPAILEVLMRKKAEEELRRHREHLEEMVNERTRELRELSHHLVNAQEKERAAIGSALHDQIGQTLTYATLLVDKMARKPEPQTLTELKSMLKEAIAEVRNLSAMLSPSLLRDAGLVQAASVLVQDFTRRTNIDIDFKHFDGVNDIPSNVALASYRIIQEALTNIVRHAQASQVQVCLKRHPGALHLEISDNGLGFNPGAVKNSTGLTGMKERAVALGGELNIQSGSGQGTRVVAEIPLAAG